MEIAEWTLFINVVNALRGWFETLRDRDREISQGEKAAVHAFYVALNETRIYLGRRDRRHLAPEYPETSFARDFDKEAQLSRLWMAAADQLRGVDNNLAERCFLKADYWANPDCWTEEKIGEANIAVDRLFEDARKLLQT